MIDVLARFNPAALIPSKHKKDIVDSILKYWFATLGAPSMILSDNEGEFNNELLRDVAKLIGIKIATTVAESLCSKGIVEHYISCN